MRTSLPFPIYSNCRPFFQATRHQISISTRFSVRPLRTICKCPLMTFANRPFSATLLLLLTISVVVVGRSIIIRRRARRVIEEAVRNGTWLPQAGRPAAKLGEKPKLFDVYTSLDGIPRRSPLNDSLLAWGGLKVPPSFLGSSNGCSPDILITQPLSATLKQPVSSFPQPSGVRSLAPGEPPASLLSRLVPKLRPLPRVTTQDAPAYPLATRQPPYNAALAVSFMIAMPTPTVKPHSSSDDPFPPVQFGVTQLPVPHGWIMDAKSESG